MVRNSVRQHKPARGTAHAPFLRPPAPLRGSAPGPGGTAPLIDEIAMSYDKVTSRFGFISHFFYSERS